MDGDLKLAFQHKALVNYFRDVILAMQKRMARLKTKDSGDLINSLDYTTTDAQADTTGGLKFLEYGRMLDMGVGRGHPLGGIAATAGLIAEQSDKKARKPRKIYSPVAYGKLNGLMEELSYGYTEEAKAALIKELEQNGNTTVVS